MIGRRLIVRASVDMFNALEKAAAVSCAPCGRSASVVFVVVVFVVDATLLSVCCHVQAAVCRTCELCSLAMMR